MSDDKRDQDDNHMARALEIFKLAIMAIPLILYHLFLGIDEWTKRQHIVVQAALTTAFGSLLGAAGLWLFNLYIVNVASRTASVSGLRLRLLPVPLSIVLYSLIFSVIFLFVLVYYMNQDLVELENRIEEIEKESGTTA